MRFRLVPPLGMLIILRIVPCSEIGDDDSGVKKKLMEELVVLPDFLKAKYQEEVPTRNKLLQKKIQNHYLSQFF